MPEIERLSESPVAAVWHQENLNSEIDYGVHSCTIAVGRESLSLPLEAKLSFGPSAELRLCSIDGQAPRGLLGGLISDDDRPWKVSIGDCSTEVDFFPVTFRTSSRGVEFELAPYRSALNVIRRDDGIKQGVFHLFNSPRLLGGELDYALLNESAGHSFSRCGRVVFDVDGFRVTLINTVDDSAQRKALSRSGGYLLTAVGKVEEIDGRLFSANEFESVLGKIHAFLSFAFGRWSGLCMPTGFDQDGNRVYEEWGTRLVSPCARSSGQSWFYEGSPDVLSSAGPGFFRLLDHPVWANELHRLLWWYLAANERGCTISIDMGIVHAHAALESLAWLYCVQDVGMVSEAAFKPGKLLAADKLRLLSKALDVPTEIPDSLDALATLSPKPFLDSPHAIAELRNDTIHPKRKRSYDGDVLWDGLKLALWTIEMSILSLSGYTGGYSSRLASGWLGPQERVPWAVK